MALAALVIALIAEAIDLGVVSIGLAGASIALLTFVVACVAIAFASRERVGRPKQASLERLPAETGRWLEQQRSQLPYSAGTLLDSISARLNELGPQLTALDPREPGADAVRRLLGTHLPALVTGYEEVPKSLRVSAGGGDRSADEHLLHGLEVIDGEIGRMIEQLGRGAYTELATQNRFLELRYENTGELG